MKDSIRKLPDAELEVMQAVWDCVPPVCRADLEKVLRPEHPMALTTLLTQLSRLADKGFLVVEKIGRTNYYTPTVSREAYLAAQSNRFFHRVCGGHISRLATALCDSGLTREELDQLRQLLEEDRL